MTTTLTEKQAFDKFVDLYMQQASVAESLKLLSEDAKESSLNVKALKKAAKIYVDAKWNDVEQEFEELKQTYTSMAE